MSAEVQGLEELDTFLGEFVSRLEPGERKKLADRVGTFVRQANARRLKGNVDPDGEPFEPRKKQRSHRLREKATRLKRRVKTKKMFLRAGGAGYLRRVATAEMATVGYTGAMARIMNVHHRGLRDNVTRDPASPTAEYPVRRVLGLPDEDRAHVLELLVDHLETT